jgi:hypothetical protein
VREVIDAERVGCAVRSRKHDRMRPFATGQASDMTFDASH